MTPPGAWRTGLSKRGADVRPDFNWNKLQHGGISLAVPALVSWSPSMPRSPSIRRYRP
jgi:hypothetical protein